MKVLEVKNLTISYHKKTAIKGINLEIESGNIIGIVGPNGAGKSTLMKGILGMIPKDTGDVKAFGQEVKKSLIKISYIPQKEIIDWDFPVNVEEVVTMGRYAHLPMVGFPGPKDKEIVKQAMEKVEITDLADRQIRNLSGGQQQRIFLARALAQESELFLLDEPFVGVDAKTERAIFALMKELKEQGKTLMVVHHDLGKVLDYFDKLILINQTLIAYGDTKDVFTPELLHKTYGGRLTVLEKTDQLQQN
jgi:manganese/zinc/iron transport system ATP- binding protein